MNLQSLANRLSQHCTDYPKSSCQLWDFVLRNLSPEQLEVLQYRVVGDATESQALRYDIRKYAKERNTQPALTPAVAPKPEPKLFPINSLLGGK